MRIVLRPEHRRAIEAHGESTYPNEGAGFLFGHLDGERAVIEALRPVTNKREAEAQYNRYELTPHDYAQAELDAARRGLDLVGIFHSHPDHAELPSQFDLDHALPNFSYLITCVESGRAKITRAWRLRADRSGFEEEVLALSVRPRQIAH